MKYDWVPGCIGFFSVAILFGGCIYSAHTLLGAADRQRADEVEYVKTYERHAREWVGDDKSIIHCRPYGKCDVIPPHPMQPYSLVCDHKGNCQLDN